MQSQQLISFILMDVFNFLSMSMNDIFMHSLTLADCKAHNSCSYFCLSFSLAFLSATLPWPSPIEQAKIVNPHWWLSALMHLYKQC